MVKKSSAKSPFIKATNYYKLLCKVEPSDISFNISTSGAEIKQLHFKATAYFSHDHCLYSFYFNICI